MHPSLRLTAQIDSRERKIADTEVEREKLNDINMASISQQSFKLSLFLINKYIFLHAKLISHLYRLPVSSVVS